MMVYAIYIVMTLVLSALYDRLDDSSGKSKWYAFTCLFLILIAGFRNGVGGDTQFYMRDFDDVPTLASDYHEYIIGNIFTRSFMPGWSILNIVCKKVFNSFYAVQLFESLIVNCCVFYLIKKYTRHVFLCALLYGISGYFFIFNTEVMREAIAIACIGIGMYHYMRGNKTYFFILVGIALMFHLSALVALLFPLTGLIPRISLKIIILSFCISFVFWIVSNTVILFLINHLPDSFPGAEKIISYADQENNIFGFFELALRYLVGMAGIIYFAQFSSGRTEKMVSDYVHYSTFFLGIAIIVCAISGFYRFLNYTAVFMLIITSEFIGNWKNQLTQFAFTKVVLVCIFFFYSGKYFYRVWPDVQRHNYELFVPYTSILDDHIDTEYRYEMWQDAVTKDRKVNNSRGLK